MSVQLRVSQPAEWRSLAPQAAEAQVVQRMIDAARETPKGHKKDYSAEMPKGYDPKFVEAAT